MPEQTGFFKYVKDAVTGYFLTIDETALLSSKAPKTDVIKGDGTAGRVFRVLNLEIMNGTDAATIKCQTYNHWDGDVVAQADNIPKGGSSGAFTLSAAGDQLTISDSAISGNTVAVWISQTVINGFTTSFNCDVAVNSGIKLSFTGDPNGGVYDLTAAVDTGLGYAYIHVLYITSA